MTKKQMKILLWNSFLTGLAFALLCVWTDASTINSGYRNLGGIALVATIGFGFRVLYLLVNGFIDWFENLRPRGDTPKVINSMQMHEPMARLPTKR